VDRALVAGFAWTDAGRCRHHNDALLDLAAASGGRLLALCCVPATDPDTAAREMERCAAAGARGFGELRLTHGATPLFEEATLEAVAVAAARLELPLLLHASEPVGHRYPGKEGGPLDLIWRLRERHPPNVLVLAHLGGGLPFYASMREIDAAFAQGRTYVDTAAAAFLYRPVAYRLLAKTVGAGCLLFGSDFPLIHPARELDRLRDAGLEADGLAAILGGTACRLFRIEGG
jgi:predicted TIM-barrel fold metal-dependent hydrolase